MDLKKPIDLQEMAKQILTAPFMGIPQKPMATACRHCGDVDVTLVCRYCELPKPCDSE